MQINKNDIIRLSDNVSYLVVSKIKYQGINYYYLVDVVDNSNIKFVTIECDAIIEIPENETLDKLLKLFIIDLQKELNRP